MTTNRALISFLGVLTAIVVAGLVGAMSGSSDAPMLLITEVHGSVKLTNPEGARKARSGIALSAEDRISTGPESRVVLSMNDSHIRLGPSSTVEVRSVSQDGVRLELENGVLEATVRPSGAVRVANRGREVVSTSGRFRVGFDGQVFGAEAIEGNIGLQGFPEAGSLAEGAEIRVNQDGAAEIGAISRELLLEVNWPKSVNKKTVWVQGRTEPGLRVMIRNAHGELASNRADSAGVFRLRIDLNEGEHDYTVVAVNPFGQEQEVTELVKLDTTGPSFRGGAEYHR